MPRCAHMVFAHQIRHVALRADRHALSDYRRLSGLRVRRTGPRTDSPDRQGDTRRARGEKRLSRPRRCVGGSIRRMDSGFFFSFMPMFVIPLVLLNAAWYVAVLVLLVRIWRRVKHLPPG